MSAISQTRSENASREPFPALAFRRVGSIAEMRATRDEWKRGGDRVALVPTMGALHEGHLSLIRDAQRRAERVVVSIYVNPLQFGPSEDFDAYPRQAEEDCALLALHGVEAAWLPSVAEMRPDGFATSVRVGALGDGLCGASRPGHFDGVATIVAQLLAVVRPDVAVFGEKDWQQLAIIRRLHRDLCLSGTIAGVPTVREADGLALSSRNRYLSADDRRRAPEIHRVPKNAAEQLRAGRNIPATLSAAREGLHSHGIEEEYLALRDENSLAPVETAGAGSRLFIAAKLGRTRLIDNLAIA